MSAPVPALEPSLGFRFVDASLDRRSDLRGDAGAIAARFADPRARFVVFTAERPVVTPEPSPTALFDRAGAGLLDARFDEAVFLGDGPDGPIFAVLAGLEPEAIVALGRETADLRGLAVAGRLAGAEYGALATGRSILHWHATNRFCPRCGSPTTPASAGWRRDCPACGTEHFPRTDPVVIMLVTDGERCLLGRSGRFATGMYSCLAGFMEPGETVEAAVRRETFEEAGIRVGRIAYFASEPWPFPASLMIGVHAEALSTEITIDAVELVDCRWFDRAEVAAMLAGTHPDGIVAPPPIAIAHHLIRRFLDDAGLRGN
jgi:NAD+ diphosphatase